MKNLLLIIGLGIILSGCQKDEVQPIDQVGNDTFIITLDGKEVSRKSNYVDYYKYNSLNIPHGFYANKLNNYLKQGFSLKSLSVWYDKGFVTCQQVNDNKIAILIRINETVYIPTSEGNIIDSGERYTIDVKIKAKSVADNSNHIIEIRAKGIKYVIL